MSGPERRFVSLDDLEIRRFAQTEPKLFIEQYKPPLVIDEFQYAPDLLPYIKIAVDGLTTKGRNKEAAGMYWLTGSQHFGLMKGVSESLAGRVALLDLFGFSPYELLAVPDMIAEPFFEQDFSSLAVDPAFSNRMRTPQEIFSAMIRGSLPLSAIGEMSVEERRGFHSSYVQTYLERDVAVSEGVRNLDSFELFFRFLAARSGQLLNLSELSRDAGVSVNTIKGWISILERNFHILLLHPYYRSLNKRLLKMPKVYFLDSGLLCYLTGWSDPEQTIRGPMARQLFESWVVANILRSYRHRGERERLSFWRTRTGQELDLWAEGTGTISTAEIKITARMDAAPFRFLDGLDPSPFKFDRRIVFALSGELMEYAPGTWNIPVGYIN